MLAAETLTSSKVRHLVGAGQVTGTLLPVLPSQSHQTHLPCHPDVELMPALTDLVPKVLISTQLPNPIIPDFLL